MANIKAEDTKSFAKRDQSESFADRVPATPANTARKAVTTLDLDNAASAVNGVGQALLAICQSEQAADIADALNTLGGVAIDNARTIAAYVEKACHDRFVVAPSGADVTLALLRQQLEHIGQLTCAMWTIVDQAAAAIDDALLRDGLTGVCRALDDAIELVRNEALPPHGAA